MKPVIFVTGFVAGALLTMVQVVEAPVTPWMATIWGAVVLAFTVGMIARGDQRFDLFSPSFITNLFFFISFGISLLLTPLDPIGPITERIEGYKSHYPAAGAVIFWTIFSINYGYHVMLKNHVINIPFIMFKFSDSSILKNLWWIYFALGLLGAVLSITSGDYIISTAKPAEVLIATIAGTLRVGLSIAFSIALAGCMSGRFKHIGWNFRLLVCGVILVLIAIPSGAKILLILPGVVIALSYNYFYKLITKTQSLYLVIVFLLFIALLFPVNLVHRQYLRQLEIDHSASVGRSVEFFAKSVQTVAELPFGESLSISMDYVFGRLSNTSIVSAVLVYQEDGGHLKMGETYAKFLFAAVPRFLWPDKPRLSLGREISQTVMGQSASSSTSTGITIPGEILYNFNPMFTPLIGFILGCLFKIIYVVFRSIYNINPQIAVIGYAMVWTGFIYPVQEGDFSSTASGMIKFILLFVMILMILSMAAKRQAPRRRQAVGDKPTFPT